MFEKRQLALADWWTPYLPSIDASPNSLLVGSQEGCLGLFCVLFLSILYTVSRTPGLRIDSASHGTLCWILRCIVSNLPVLRSKQFSVVCGRGVGIWSKSFTEHHDAPYNNKLSIQLLNDWSHPTNNIWEPFRILGGGVGAQVAEIYTGLPTPMNMKPSLPPPSVTEIPPFASEALYLSETWGFQADRLGVLSFHSPCPAVKLQQTQPQNDEETVQYVTLNSQPHPQHFSHFPNVILVHHGKFKAFQGASQGARQRTSKRFQEVLNSIVEPSLQWERVMSQPSNQVARWAVPNHPQQGKFNFMIP